jgi:hypothetical protein
VTRATSRCCRMPRRTQAFFRDLTAPGLRPNRVVIAVEVNLLTSHDRHKTGRGPLYRTGLWTWSKRTCSSSESRQFDRCSSSSQRAGVARGQGRLSGRIRRVRHGRVKPAHGWRRAGGCVAERLLERVRKIRFAQSAVGATGIALDGTWDRAYGFDVGCGAVSTGSSAVGSVSAVRGLSGLAGAVQQDPTSSLAARFCDSCGRWLPRS